jgi:hypothetical protein
MSRGLGAVQVKVRDFFRRRPCAAITTEELNWYVYGGRSKPTRAQIVALIRSAKRLAEVYPIGYLEAARRGRPLIFYRTDNQESVERAELMCKEGNKQAVLKYLPRSYKPPKPEPQRSGWWRPTAAPGAIAAAYKFLLQKGQEPTVEVLMEFFSPTLTDTEIIMALSDLHSGGIWSAFAEKSTGSIKSDSLNLRQQTGKLIVSELTVFPADFNAEIVLCDHFALHPVWCPDDDFMELESLCFWSVHRD